MIKYLCLSGTHFFASTGTYTFLAGTGHDTSFLYVESDGVVKKNYSLYSRKAYSMSAHNSHVWDISISPLHCVVASVGSNGTAMVKPFADRNSVYTKKEKVQ